MKILIKVWSIIIALLLSQTAMAINIYEDDINFVGNPSNEKKINAPDGGYLRKAPAGDWYQSKDGVLEKKIGSGSGSGGGENFNNGFTDTQNPNAEDGTTGWTASAGTFAASTSDPIEGDRSFTWTPAAQNDYLDSPILNFDRDVFRGRSCQAQIEYFGGDANLTLQVLNADDEVLGEQVLQAHTITATESVFFLCPSETDISGDADKGNLRLRILNEGATASAQIKFDKSYVGTLIGLSETVLPDVLSAYINSSEVVESTNVPWINNCVSGTDNRIDCSFIAGTFNEVPSCRANVFQATMQTGTYAYIYAITTSTISIARYFNGTTNGSIAVNLECSKQGADAKQSVQVYKSVPKVSENVNEFGGWYDLTTVIKGQFPNEWAGTVTISGTSGNTKEIDITSMGLTSTPNCTVGNGMDSATYIANYRLGGSTPTKLQFSTRDIASSLGDYKFNFKCTKTGADFKMPTVQPVIVGQVTNSWAESASKNVRQEACTINNTGTPSINSGPGLCESWVNSVTDLAGGQVRLNIDSSIFPTSQPVCVCSQVANDGKCRVASSGQTEIEINTYNAAGSLSDGTFQIICQGKR